MNILPTYEQTIAERMEGMPIPDMADAIWSRVEAALDVELPVDDKPFFKKPAVWIIGAGIIAIIIVLFIVSKNRHTAPPPQKILPQQTAPDTTTKADFKPPDTVALMRRKATHLKHVVDTTTVIAMPDSLLKPSPVIQMPPVIKIPSPEVINPPIEPKQRPKYGVEVSDSSYRLKATPKQ